MTLEIIYIFNKYSLYLIFIKSVIFTEFAAFKLDGLDQSQSPETHKILVIYPFVTQPVDFTHVHKP